MVTPAKSSEIPPMDVIDAKVDNSITPKQHKAHTKLAQTDFIPNLH
jgi:hypothetical protein